MKYVIYGLLVLLHYALMTALLPQLLPAFIAVDFAIICVVSIAMYTKDLTAGLFGLAIGLLLDLFTGPAFGLYMLFYGLLGAVVAKVYAKAGVDNILIAVGTMFVAYLLRDVYLFVFQIAYARAFFPALLFIKFSSLSAIITAAIGLVWCFLLGRLHQLRSLRPKVEHDFHLYDYDEPMEWR